MLDYMYMMPNDCPTCKGVNKFCPDCEYRQLWRKAEKLKLDTGYKIDNKNKDTIDHLVTLFGEKSESHIRNWKITIVNNKAKRILI